MSIKYLRVIRQALKSQRNEPADIKRSRDEYEFQPGYLEIVERPPAPWTRRTALALTLLLLLTLLWSVIGRLDIHASAAGRLLVSSNSKVIQSIESGEVAAINVRDGQWVKKGDVLIELNPIGIKAEIQEIQERLNFKKLELARLQALLSDEPLSSFIVPTGVSPLQVKIARAHLRSEWSEVKANIESINGEMGVNLANQQARRKEITGLGELAANIKNRLDAQRTLAKNNLIPRMVLLEQEREKLEMDRSLSQQYTRIDVLQAEYKSKQEQRRGYLAKVRREYYDKLNEVQASIAVMEQQLIKLLEKYRLQSLRAPVSGVVQQLDVHTLGGAVEAAKPLMIIVPDDAVLEIEVKILNKDVGFVHSGQDVEIKIDSFPYTRYGTIPGKVAYVSRDSVEDERLGLVFLARVRIAQRTILVEDKEVPLQAGMSVNVEIRTGDRRVIDYLLSPLQQYQSEAMKER
ncbi:HlyD family type I secretion periplasmic adaptor subunit [Moritella sp.]|uniref:HlyD family type I secretion periplasmic adaptor subunit n=1 Tax=Moritella sp. TaxID=78556 RepID=UPI001D8404E9|nr:HlyD family type I secretion periplasmic adaptor subunit [Moritella sp.]MCJ8349622.1 HlyD family type I secretion periplasmic adaptor subunit [Moritella sp.]NQZ41181.1 HlyD family type I secretion periplasmic adaptor subunit [Moritella sp.]